MTWPKNDESDTQSERVGGGELCRRGDLNDPAFHVIQRQRTAPGGSEHGFRGRRCRSGTLHAARCHRGVLANHLQADTPSAAP